MTRRSLILFLLLFSSLIVTQPVLSQFCGSANGDLYVLPACAVAGDSGTLADWAYLTSVAPQTVIVLPGQNVSFTVSYQVWSNPAYPCPGVSCPYDLLFIPSWTPNWPPDMNFIRTVYSGLAPGTSPPGTKGSASFQITAPMETGTYLLWFVWLSGYRDVAYGVSIMYPSPLRPPGHIKVIVSTHTSTVTATVTAKNTGALVSPPLSIPLVPIGVAGVAVAVSLTSTVLLTKRRRSRSARSRAGFANLDELLLTVDTEVSKQDRVLATVMFTDIVRSTEWAAKLGDREWRDLLNRHFDLIRKELDRFSGREVGTTGDGMLAVFAGPERAVRCACSIRDAVRSLGLEVRIGIHTGEMQLTTMPGLDHVAGIAVHIGARVAAQAEPGEILVSSTTKDLITGAGIEFKDQGMRVLKGVPGEWHLFAVAAE